MKGRFGKTGLTKWGAVMSELSFKKVPIREQRKAQRWSYRMELFSDESPYSEALMSAEKVLRQRRPGITIQEWSNFRTLLVHECEMAKDWRSLWDDKVDPQRATSEWVVGSRASLREVIGHINLLRKKDKWQGYDLREAFFRSAQIAVSPAEQHSAIMPDSNLLEVPTGGRIAQTVELQFLSRLFLGKFDQWIDALEHEINTLHQEFRLGRRIGPMFLEPPIGDAALARRDATQLAILALVGRLRKAFSIALDAHCSRLPNYDALGGEMPSRVIASWGLVHQFVQAAFGQEAIGIDLPALKERWSVATKGRKIRLTAWPMPVESQVNA